MTTLLCDLPNGVSATVAQVCANGPGLDEHHLRRLCELGFLPGETVQILHRGPGGREPLAVQVGDTMFALRLLEARCIAVHATLQDAARSDLPNSGVDAARR
jgi:ferrous iron transport protein A